MMYAPIIIPTLNRVNHLARCIESLSDNYGANNTDLIISVDFPPSSKYIEGHKNVCEFLQDNDLFCKFNSVNVYYQENNIGAYNNVKFLYQKAGKKSNCCIFTEDDNIFSHNFLLYVNECLRIFENDDRIIGVCGSKEVDWYNETNDTVVASKLFSAYGVGVWLDKERRIDEDVKKLLLSRKTFSFGNLLELRKQNTTLFNKYVNSILLKKNKPFWNDDELAMIDTTKTIYMYLTDHFCVVPSECKSKTFGNDGSGINMKKNNYSGDESKKPLDNKEDFHVEINGTKIGQPSEYTKNMLCYCDKNNKKAEAYLRKATNWRGDIKALIGALYLQVFGRKK